MQINSAPDTSSPAGFFAVNFEIFAQSLEESEITFSCEMGGGVVIHHGSRGGDPIWLLDNPMGGLYGVWIEDNASLSN